MFFFGGQKDGEAEICAESWSRIALRGPQNFNVSVWVQDVLLAKIAMSSRFLIATLRGLWPFARNYCKRCAGELRVSTARKAVSFFWGEMP